MSENGFEVNEWVRRKSNSHKGSVVGVIGDYVRVHWFLYSSNRPLIDNLAIIDLHPKNEIEKLPDEPREYSYDELVVAFMTEDKEWYYEVLALKGANQ